VAGLRLTRKEFEMISEYPLWKSRKFWLLILDTVVSVATYFVGLYVLDVQAEQVLFLIASLQPVFLFLITAYTVQNIKLAE
jgi:hypothetical protein